MTGTQMCVSSYGPGRGDVRVWGDETETFQAS